MKPRRTTLSDTVFRLPGGTEDNDLWVTVYDDSPHGGPILGSTWVPSDEERQAIADGANVELLVWGTGHPPVAIRLSTYTLGKAAASDDDDPPGPAGFRATRPSDPAGGETARFTTEEP